MTAGSLSVQQLATTADRMEGLAQKASLLLATRKAKKKSFTLLPVCHKFLLLMTAEVRI